MLQPNISPLTPAAILLVTGPVFKDRFWAGLARIFVGVGGIIYPGSQTLVKMVLSSGQKGGASECFVVFSRRASSQARSHDHNHLRICTHILAKPEVEAAGPYELIGIGGTDVTKPYKVSWCGDIEAPKNL